jgi:enoyl-CoA hydratase/carnithine racemase
VDRANRIDEDESCQEDLVSEFLLELYGSIHVLRLQSEDGTNRLTSRCVLSLTDEISRLARQAHPLPNAGWIAGLVVAGNDRFFSAGADLAEISALDGPSAYEFSKMGQALMAAIADFPAPVYAAISGYCMGGGLDLALACHHRIASPHAIFGHRGAALGLITGWGGTQRLPRLIGKGRALEMFVAAEKISAKHALRMGLIDAIADDPVVEAVRRLAS